MTTLISFFFFRLERNLEKFALGPHFIPVAAIDGTTIRASRPSQLTAVNIRRSPSGRNWRTFVGHRTTGRGADMGLARVGKDKKKGQVALTLPQKANGRQKSIQTSKRDQHASARLSFYVLLAQRGRPVSVIEWSKLKEARACV